MYHFATICAVSEPIPELEPFDGDELDDIFARLEKGDEETEDEYSALHRELKCETCLGDTALDHMAFVA